MGVEKVCYGQLRLLGAFRKRSELIDVIVIGVLKGYDQLMNLVLDEVKEAMTGECIPNFFTFTI